MTNHNHIQDHASDQNEFGISYELWEAIMEEMNSRPVTLAKRQADARQDAEILVKLVNVFMDIFPEWASYPAAFDDFNHGLLDDIIEMKRAGAEAEAEYSEGEWNCGGCGKLVYGPTCPDCKEY